MPISVRSHKSYERRRSIRFPLHLGADCSFHRAKAPVTIQCLGEVKDLSTGGCCVVLNEAAPVDVGMLAHLRIDWPAKLHDSLDMQLHLRGFVLRVDGRHVAVINRSYDFRLKGKQRPGDVVPRRMTRKGQSEIPFSIA